MRSIAKAPLIGLAAALLLGACATRSEDTGSAPGSASARPMEKAVRTDPTVGGAVMFRTKTIIQNASEAPNLTTLVKAVQAAGLVDTLSGPGPYTVFAPTNEAFGRLAPGTVDTLLKPENKPSLVKVLTYHVVPGAITSQEIRARIEAGGGTATLTTVEGDPLTASLTNNVITLTDVNGNKSYVQTSDVIQSNGIVQVVNGVLIPKLS
jgi:uncharacterized surface protein with fasciclin (FAS1) repeats